jgi:glycine betaine/proline transport system ATP-binding protein
MHSGSNRVSAAALWNSGIFKIDVGDFRPPFAVAVHKKDWTSAVKLSERMRKTTIFVTHDLNEATIVGDRIAIMRDGAFVQVAIPEEIITKPVDAYVSEFVRDISPLSQVSARNVMAPFDSCCVDLADSTNVLADENLAYLLDLAARFDKTIVVLDNQGQRVGLITRDILLSWMNRNGILSRKTKRRRGS